MTVSVDRLCASIEQPMLITRCVFHTLLQLLPADFKSSSSKISVSNARIYFRKCALSWALVPTVNAVYVCIFIT